MLVASSALGAATSGAVALAPVPGAGPLQDEKGLGAFPMPRRRLSPPVSLKKFYQASKLGRLKGLKMNNEVTLMNFFFFKRFTCKKS